MIYVLIFAVFWPIVAAMDLFFCYALFSHSRQLDHAYYEHQNSRWSTRSLCFAWLCWTCLLWPLHLIIGWPIFMGEKLGTRTGKSSVEQARELKLAKEEIAKEETRIRALIRNESLDPLGLLGDDAKKPMRGEVLGALAVRTTSLPDRYPTRSTRTLTEIYSEPFEQR